ncbi:MAG: HPr family phosphocarrier protein [Lachnospiraceae bacterium]|nr:HPr family phosphocarrier protein [Lachnospiraceae bacterium]
MKKFKIKLMSPNDVEEFVKIASKFDFDIDLVSGTVYLDAKSLLGVLSMGLKRELNVLTMGDDPEFASKIKKFSVA